MIFWLESAAAAPASGLEAAAGWLAAPAAAVVLLSAACPPSCAARCAVPAAISVWAAFCWGAEPLLPLQAAKVIRMDAQSERATAPKTRLFIVFLPFVQKLHLRCLRRPSRLRPFLSSASHHTENRGKNLLF